ncbi:MAG: kynureninase [Pseudonocardia sp.]
MTERAEPPGDAAWSGRAADLDTARAGRAAELDAADPLAHLRSQFLDAPGVVAYFDGNSLGRPLAGTADRLDRFVRDEWAGRLIRGWTDGWMDWPERVGDRLAAAALGAKPGQVVVADSTTVMLYKLARAAVDARPDRREIVVHAGDFPTDRYVAEGIAAERGCVLRWIDTVPVEGVTPEHVASVVGPDTALVLLSHVDYRSGWLADAPVITALAHDAGALVLWDVSHSAGSVELALDAWDVDLAVGCTYKYLGGGPGSPAFGYVRRGLQKVLRQPIQGWMGRRDPFEMAPGYVAASGPRGMVSGTPPILAMLPLLAGLDLLEEAGIVAVRTKSVQLTEFAVGLADAWLAGHDVQLASPRDPARRGGHVTLRRPGFRVVLDELWRRGVLPDYRELDGIRIGLAPLSTSFTEVHCGLSVLRDVLAES